MFYFSHTSDVESINSLRLSYLPKRTSFGFEAMEARNWVVILDHNFHLHRKYKLHADDSCHMHRSYSKRSKKESVRLVKEAKTYPYIAPLISLSMRFAVHGTPNQLVGASFNPKTIAPTIRGEGFVSTPTEILVQKHTSRFH